MMGLTHTLRLACEGVFTRIFPWLLVRSCQSPYMATEVARPYTLWLLSLGPHEGISVWNKGWFKSSTVPSYFCSRIAPMQSSRHHYVCYPVSTEVCWKVHSNQRRTLGTITVKQVLAGSIPNYAPSVLLDIHMLCQVLGNLRLTSWKDCEFY
jgi:hypothetical protein